VIVGHFKLTVIFSHVIFLLAAVLQACETLRLFSVDSFNVVVIYSDNYLIKYYVTAFPGIPDCKDWILGKSNNAKASATTSCASQLSVLKSKVIEN
jgi:hypothetical protein